MKNGLDISSFGATDTGCVRENNEDTLITMQLWDMRHTLLVAIDGMGGEEGGEVAAEIARKTIIEFLTNNRDGSVLGLLKQAMALANNEIVKAAEEDPRLHRMGCVATAGIVSLDEATLYVAHVGDSRLYRYSRGELTKLTHDHSLVGYQEEQGLLTEEQAMHHPRRSVIERCLGSGMHTADERGFIDGSLFPLVGGETFVFCSDGLCDMVTSAQIAECLRNNKTVEDKCLALIEAAKDAGGKDNVTVIVADITDSNPPTTTAADAAPAAPGAKSGNAARGGNAVSAVSLRKQRMGTLAILVVAGLVLLTAGFFLGRCTASQAEEPLTTGKQGRAGWLPQGKGGADTVKKDTVKYVANPAVDDRDGTNGKENGETHGENNGGKSNGQKSETNQQSDKQGR